MVHNLNIKYSYEPIYTSTASLLSLQDSVEAHHAPSTSLVYKISVVAVTPVHVTTDQFVHTLQTTLPLT